MAMRPLHRGRPHSRCVGLPWRAIRMDACIALAVFQIRRYRNSPIAALQLGALDRDPIQLNRITVLILCFEHDLVRKTVSTFRDHALERFIF